MQVSENGINMLGQGFIDFLDSNGIAPDLIVVESDLVDPGFWGSSNLENFLDEYGLTTAQQESLTAAIGNGMAFRKPAFAMTSEIDSNASLGIVGFTDEFSSPDAMLDTWSHFSGIDFQAKNIPDPASINFYTALHEIGHTVNGLAEENADSFAAEYYTIAESTHPELATSPDTPEFMRSVRIFGNITGLNQKEYTLSAIAPLPGETPLIDFSDPQARKNAIGSLYQAEDALHEVIGYHDQDGVRYLHVETDDQYYSAALQVLEDPAKYGLDETGVAYLENFVSAAEKYAPEHFGVQKTHGSEYIKKASAEIPQTGNTDIRNTSLLSTPDLAKVMNGEIVIAEGQGVLTQNFETAKLQTGLENRETPQSKPAPASDMTLKT